MQGVIMAGGKGTRLRTITHDEIPKSMALVSGKPILQWQIEQLRCQNVSDIILVIGYLGEKIRSFFGDGTQFGVTIRYIEETAPLGTAGALSELPLLLKEQNFLLLFGDVLFDVDLARMLHFHMEKKAQVTLFIHPNTHPQDSDLVICDTSGRVLGFDSKHNDRSGRWLHNLVNAGLYLMNQNVCQAVPKNTQTDLEKDLLTRLICQGALIYGYQSSEYVKDVGTATRIAEATADMDSGFTAKRSLRQKQRAIFLDRDGTINQKNGLISREDQFELDPCATQAIGLINQSGYLAIVVTNQPVVARGMCEMEDVDRIHRKMETLLGQAGVYLDDIRFCPHHPDWGYPEENSAYKVPCLCRKPSTGMLDECAARYNIDLSASWIIGDSTTDIQTGLNAGMHTALVLTGDGGADGKYPVVSELVCENLLEAVKKILVQK